MILRPSLVLLFYSNDPMKIIPSFLRHGAKTVLIAIWATCPVISSALAATYTWDADGVSPLNDGSGNWNSSGGTNWYSGASFGAWGNTSSDLATFGVANGAAGAITVGSVTANGILFAPPGSGSYTLSGGTITLAGTNAAITTQTGGSATIGSVIAGSAGLFKLGQGTLTLNGSSSNTFNTAGANVFAGTLLLDFSNMSTPTDLINSSQPLNLASGTLSIKGKSSGTTSQTFNGNINTSASPSANGITLDNNGGSGTTLAFTGTGVNRTAGTTLNIDLSNGGTISTPSFTAGTQGYITVKDGSGTGFGAVTGGQLVRATTTALPATAPNGSTDYKTSGSFTASAGAKALSTLVLDGIASTGALDLNTGTMTINRKGLMLIGNNNYSVSNGTLASGSGNELMVHTMGSGTLTLNTPIAGANQIIKNGPGTLSIPGGDSHTGATFLLQGTLAVGNDASLGTGAITVGGNSTLRSDANITLNNNVTIHGPTGAAPLVGDRTFTVNTNGNNLAANGVISGGGNIVKSGSGTLTLTGTHTYTGSTTVSAGTLLISSGSMNSTSQINLTGGVYNYNSTTGLNRNVTVNGGNFKYNSSSAYTGTFSLTSGTVSGSGNLGSTPLSIGSGVTLAPGNSPGTTNSGTQTWASLGTYQWEINKVAASGGAKGNINGWDWDNITGNLNITATSGSKFTIDIVGLEPAGNSSGVVTGFNNTLNYTWTIASVSGSISGFDPSLFNLSTTNFSNNNALGGGNFSIEQAGTDINLKFTAVPEPSAWSLLVLGAAAIPMMHRFRRKQ